MSGNSTTPVTGMACSDEMPPCSSTLGGDAIKAQLQAMFPNISQATINNTVDQALDLSEAIDQLLSRGIFGYTITQRGQSTILFFSLALKSAFHSYKWVQ